MKIKIEIEIDQRELGVLRDVSNGLSGAVATATLDAHHEWTAAAFDMAESGLLSLDILTFEYGLTKIGRAVIEKTWN
jgi:hypothetical protein